MAQNVSIKDAIAARKWLAKVSEIDQDYQKAMREASETLKDMENFCEGTIIDELVDCATNMLNAAEAVYNTMSSMADLVNTILDKAEQFKETVKEKIGSSLKKYLG